MNKFNNGDEVRVLRKRTVDGLAINDGYEIGDIGMILDCFHLCKVLINGIEYIIYEEALELVKKDKLTEDLTFYYDANMRENQCKYVYCQRPSDTTMSLTTIETYENNHNFCGYASEGYDKANKDTCIELKEIGFGTYIHGVLEYFTKEGKNGK